MSENIVKLDVVMIYKDRYPLPIITNDIFMEEFEKMELREDDIFVITYPKSGTHWMQEIVNLILVNGHVEKLNSSNRRIVIELADVTTFTAAALAEAGPVLRQVKDAPSPRVLSTHVPFPLLPKQLREKRCKVIYVYRHPKDAIVSYYNFSLKFAHMEYGHPILHTPQQFAHFFDAAVPGKFEYGSWFDHVLGYYQLRHDDNFFAVSYEDMKTNLREVVKRVASFIGRHLDEDALSRVVEGASFQTMKESYKKDHNQNKDKGKGVLDANMFVHKGQTSQWTEYFTAEQNETFDKLFRDKMVNCEWTVPYEPRHL